jgi:hypothetical protein
MISRIMLSAAMIAGVSTLTYNMPTSIEDAQAMFQNTSVVAGEYPQLPEGQTMEEAMYSGAFSYTGE